MATVTSLGRTHTTTAGNKTFTGTSVTNDLIVVVTVSTGVATSAVSDNDGGTYTQVGTTRTGFSTTGNLQMWVRTALVASGKSTIYTATQTSSTGGGLHVLRVSEALLAGSASVRSTGGQSTGTAGTTPAPVLSATPQLQNVIIAAVANGTNGAATVTQRSGYTEDGDSGYNTPATGFEVCHLNSGETSATLTFGSTTATAFASYGIEILISETVVSTDTTNITESVSLRIPTYFVSETETTNVTDTATVIKTILSLSVSDTTAVTDFPFYFDDTLFMNEVVTISLPIAGPSLNVSDTSNISELVTMSGTEYLSVNDTSNISDTVSVYETSYNINVSDTSNISEVVIMSGTEYINVSDTSTITESVVTAGTEYINVSDTTVVTDIAGSPDDNVFVFDQVQVTIAVATATLNVSDTTAITESVTMRLFSYVNVSDTTAITEQVTMAGTEYINTSDTSNISESVTMRLFSNVSVSDTTTVTELVTMAGTEYLSTSDTSAITDTVSIYETAYFINVNDTTAITEQVVMSGTEYINTSDTSTVTDTVSLYEDKYLIDVSDTSVVTESTTLLLISSGSINVADTTTVTDSSQITVSDLSINVSDSSTITENIQMAGNLYINIVGSSATDTIVPNSTLTSSAGGYIFTGRITATASGELSSLGVRFATGGSGNYILGIYTDDNTGGYPKPGTLLAQTASTASASGWQDVALTGVTIASGTKYQIAVTFSSGVDTWYYAAGSGTYLIRAYQALPTTGAFLENTNVIESRMTFSGQGEVISVTDTTSISLSASNLSLSVSDTSSISEVITMAGRGYINTSDTSAVTDTVSLYEDKYFVSVSDTSALTESITILLISPGSINVADTTAVTESASVLVANLALSVSDSTTTTESVAVTVNAPVITGRLKYWNGSSWILKPLKYWNGSSWIEKNPKYWNGSSWIQ